MTRIISIRHLPSRRTLHIPHWLGAVAWRLLFSGTHFVNKFLPGYSQPMGAKIEIIVDHDGPASYNNTGTFATSGETINAIDFGIGGFETVDANSLSSDGLNYVWIDLIGDGPGIACIGAVLHWYVASSNLEVANAVNLSGKSIRLQIRGV